MPVRDRDLLFSAEDLLDPDEAQDLQERLAADPALRARLAALLRETAAVVPPPPPSVWRLPPPGMGWRADLGMPAVMNAPRADAPHTVRVGRRFQILLDPVAQPEDLEVVLLQRRAGVGWTVRFPRTAAERTPLTRLRQREDGRWQVDLAAEGPPGPQRWAIALAPRRLQPDWTAPDNLRWEPLQQAIACGEISAATVHLEVVLG